MKEKIANLGELKKWILKISESFQERQLILLEGNLGVGKTQTVKLLVEELGGEIASSPTFSFHNKYLLKPEKKGGAHRQVDHLDLYRIESEEELESIGFWDIFEQPAGWIFIEWPGKVDSSFWPLQWKPVCLSLEFADNPNERYVKKHVLS